MIYNVSLFCVYCVSLPYPVSDPGVPCPCPCAMSDEYRTSLMSFSKLDCYTLKRSGDIVDLRFKVAEMYNVQNLISSDLSDESWPYLAMKWSKVRMYAEYKVRVTSYWLFNMILVTIGISCGFKKNQALTYNLQDAPRAVKVQDIIAGRTEITLQNITSSYVRAHLPIGAPGSYLSLLRRLFVHWY